MDQPTSYLELLDNHKQSDKRWNAISSILHGLSNSAKGYATVSVTAYSSATRLSVTATMQKASGSSWTDHTTWTASGTGTCDLNESYSVGSGTYRLKSKVVAKDSSGKTLDDTTVTSATKTY